MSIFLHDYAIERENLKLPLPINFHVLVLFAHFSPKEEEGETQSDGGKGGREGRTGETKKLTMPEFYYL